MDDVESDEEFAKEMGGGPVPTGKAKTTSSAPKTSTAV
jgi:hypothetical protein